MWFGFKGITDDGLAHHSCGFLFGVLHDDSDRLSDIFNKVISDPWLGVQDCATNVDAAKEKKNKSSYSTPV